MEINLFIETVFTHAKTKKFDAFELYFESGEALGITAFEEEIINYSDSQSKGVSFRGTINGKSGAAFSEVLDEDAALFIVTKAYEAATLIENDDQITLIDTSFDYLDLNLYNPILDKVENSDKIAFALNLDKIATSHPQISKVSAVYVGNGNYHCRLVNSYGVDIGYKRNYIYGGIAVVAKENDNSHSTVVVKSANDFTTIKQANLEQQAIKKVLAKIGAKPVKSGKYPIVLSPEASSDLLSVFMPAFSADTSQKGLSLLKGKIDQPIASDVISLIDDPHLKDGLASCPFDGEGVPTFKKSLIERGTFKTFLHNMNTAKKDGVSSTGNAHRSSFKSGVSVSYSNAYFEPSTTSLEALYHQVGSGLIITEFDGLHAGANSVTGDFSLSCRGFVLNDGEKSDPFRGVVVSGNYFELLKHIVAVADDLTFDNSPIGSPTLYVSELRIAGE